jgi:hypothetical protein
LRFLFVTRLETGLSSSDFAFEVEDAPGAADQTVLLLHRFVHGYEYEAVGTDSISEQWTSVDRAGAEFCAGCQLGEESGVTLTLPMPQVFDPQPGILGGEGRNRTNMTVIS